MPMILMSISVELFDVPIQKLSDKCLFSHKGVYMIKKIVFCAHKISLVFLVSAYS